MAEIVLHLKIRVQKGKRDAFLAFLRDARPFYESPGGIRVRLLQDRDDDHAFIEVVEYDTLRAYELDDHRVRNDPQMKAYLTCWRELLDGSPIVETYLDRCSDI